MAERDDAGDRLIEALLALEEVADALTPDQAARALTDASLQTFWRDWPNLSSWAAALWRRLDVDLSEAARPPQDPELDEVGGSG